MYEITNKFLIRILSGKPIVKKIPKKEYRDFINFSHYAYDFKQFDIDDFLNIIYSQIWLTNLTVDDFYRVLRDKTNHRISIRNNEQTLKEINELFAGYSKYKLMRDLETALQVKPETKTKKVKI